MVCDKLKLHVSVFKQFRSVKFDFRASPDDVKVFIVMQCLYFNNNR